MGLTTIEGSLDDKAMRELKNLRYKYMQQDEQSDND
jgi:hypothetical protein